MVYNKHAVLNQLTLSIKQARFAEPALYQHKTSTHYSTGSPSAYNKYALPNQLTININKHALLNQLIISMQQAPSVQLVDDILGSRFKLAREERVIAVC